MDEEEEEEGGSVVKRRRRVARHSRALAQAPALLSLASTGREGGTPATMPIHPLIQAGRQGN